MMSLPVWLPGSMVLLRVGLCETRGGVFVKGCAGLNPV